MLDEERTHDEQAREQEERGTTLALAEEQPDVRKHVREVGSVIVRTRIIEERKLVEVTLRREEVTVERVAAATPGGSDARWSQPERDGGAREAFREQTVEIPVYEETFEVVKRPRLRETLRISKTARYETQRVPMDVRREGASVETTGAVEERRRAGDGWRAPPRTPPDTH